ncbi:unnamed protein product [Spirodela intermedia]|uniref:Uncharacterized protein n=1 Tax=Spirodela intermedia TaxID=51605 RepID=A0A7I8JRB4_SPIIN|nr:unnamed protein product [Spirodela intermedia]CAA6672710.1 unnamed protein product [Spirodela intermedia]
MARETTRGAFRTSSAVTISYSELKDKKSDLSAKIKEGFGPNGLGILSVSDVRNKQDLLHLSPGNHSRDYLRQENLKRELEDPDSRYSFGWSHGKEKLESGNFDTFKGSFYANPILDIPTTDISLIQRYPSYCRPNKWPNTSLPELEGAFKALAKLIMDVGLLLAYHCDKYVSENKALQQGESLEDILGRSRCHKGRLLYYFPRRQSSTENLTASSWCGWHTDLGSLTGLTCGMFTRNGLEISPPDSAAGLYVRTREEEVVKVVFGEDQIAYQIGETTEILSRGHLCATPHCVKIGLSCLSIIMALVLQWAGPERRRSCGGERSTFALFMQPDWDQQLRFANEVHLHRELIPLGGALTFGEYSEMLLDEHYHRRLST